jgi:hypothetical protein
MKKIQPWIFRQKWINRNYSKNTLGRTHEEIEAWEFLQEKRAGLLSLYLRASACFIHIYKCKTAIIIQR